MRDGGLLLLTRALSHHRKVRLLNFRPFDFNRWLLDHPRLLLLSISNDGLLDLTTLDLFLLLGGPITLFSEFVYRRRTLNYKRGLIALWCDDPLSFVIRRGYLLLRGIGRLWGHLLRLSLIHI